MGVEYLRVHAATAAARVQITADSLRLMIVFSGVLKSHRISLILSLRLMRVSWCVLSLLERAHILLNKW